MRLRLAYLKKELNVPDELIFNFDHTGLHFMQVRAATWTIVEEDAGTHMCFTASQTGHRSGGKKCSQID